MSVFFCIFLNVLWKNFFVELFKEEEDRDQKNLQSMQQALYIVQMERCRRKLQGRGIEKKLFTGADGMTL